MIISQDIKLKEMSVKVTNPNAKLVPEKSKAKFNFNHDFSQKEKILIFNIQTTQEDDIELYTVTCTFSTNLSITDDEKTLNQIITIMQPRLEEILALIAFQSGFISDFN